MKREGYRVTADFEATHWWFLSRRDLFLAQLEKAARDLGFPGRRLSLLDFGCGTGFYLRFLARYGDVTGADRFGGELDRFWKGNGCERIDSSELGDRHRGCFDVVTALDVLEHLDDDAAGLDRLAKLLAPRGQIILTVPAYTWLWGGEDEISGHRRRYSKRSLLAVSALAGLEPLFFSHFNLGILPAMAAVIAFRKAIAGKGAKRSNLRAVPGPVNRLLYRLTSMEARMVGREKAALPAGASIVCRLRKKRTVS
ncbi:MAG: class I SAM-dependent methyltransferase [Deltaproteobacteria bacterium]|nr:class I SAM-dependent methyltransferase [Deltaproteobacteria bacterium]